MRQVGQGAGEEKGTRAEVSSAQNLLIFNCFHLMLIILNMWWVTDLVGIRCKFLAPKKLKGKLLGAMGLR